jgi:hypothetical protein
VHASRDWSGMADVKCKPERAKSTRKGNIMSN